MVNIYVFNVTISLNWFIHGHGTCYSAADAKYIEQYSVDFDVIRSSLRVYNLAQIN